MNIKFIFISMTLSLLFQIKFVKSSSFNDSLNTANKQSMIKIKISLNGTLHSLPVSAWFTETLIEKLENKNKITALEAIQSLMDELDLAIEQPHDFSMRTNQIKFKRVIINKSLLKI
jgi:hypothetical protein